MRKTEPEVVESEKISDFDRVMNMGRIESSEPVVRETPHKPRFNLDPEKTKNGLGQLVLAVVKLLHELLEKQAIRRIDGGSLTDEEIERVGLALMGQSEEIERLRHEFNLDEEDLNLDLGPLGKLL